MSIILILSIRVPVVTKSYIDSYVSSYMDDVCVCVCISL